MRGPPASLGLSLRLPLWIKRKFSRSKGFLPGYLRGLVRFPTHGLEEWAAFRVGGDPIRLPARPGRVGGRLAPSLASFSHLHHNERGGSTRNRLWFDS